MGIPGLLSQLEQYSTEVFWYKMLKGQQLSSCSADLVIDGPCFAYWVYRHYVTTRSPLPMLALYPDYYSIGQTAIQLLNEFESFGLRIKKIYFDGLLPEYKIQTRLHRQQRLVHQVKAVKSKHVALDCHFTSQMESLARFTPTFLVPSILETLLDSKYSDRTVVIPGEAEAFCAHPENCHKDDIVLTNDSDSILYNPLGRVVFLAWLEFRISEHGNDVLRVLSIDCSVLRRQLNCHNLQLIGFWLSRNPSWSLKECAQEAKHKDSDTSNYNKFRDQYATNVLENGLLKHLCLPSDQLATNSLLQRLDPRISEIVYTFCASEMNISRQMSLPMLLEDVSRASAWTASTYVRNVAYSLLAHVIGIAPDITSIFEVDRRGDNVGQHAVNILDRDQLAYECSQIVSHLTKLSLNFPGFCNGCIYIAYVIEQLNPGSVVSIRPKRLDISLVLCPEYEHRLEWAQLHLHAQATAFMYSLRVLSQVVEVLLNISLAKVTSATAFLLELRSLHTVLKRMPRLSNSLPRPAYFDNMVHAKCKKQFEALLDSLTWAEEIPVGGRKAKKKKKHKR